MQWSAASSRPLGNNIKPNRVAELLIAFNYGFPIKYERPCLHTIKNKRFDTFITLFFFVFGLIQTFPTRAGKNRATAACN